jgi:general secretion pathway protein G
MRLHAIKRSHRGFTLAEMMAVIVIIGLLATLVVPNVLGKWDEAARTKARTDITSLVNAATEYAVRNGGRYPDTLDALVAPDESGHAYLQSRTLPLDPWKHEYVYEAPVPGAGDPRPRIASMGKDGQADTADDIGSEAPR